MNFDYQINNNHLYLAPGTKSPLFTFNGVGFTPSTSEEKKHISEILTELDNSTASKLLTIEASRYPNSVRYEELKKLASDFVFWPEEELIFFGGSFNPWHQGHKACLDLLGERSCIILPDRNPFKDIVHLSPLEIYQEIVQELNLEHHYLNPEFILQVNKNPTYTWIKRTQKRFPHLHLSLLMGMDSLESIETWHEADALLRTLHSIYVASRLEDETKQMEIKKSLQKFSQLQLHFLGRHPFESISSTEIRNKF